MKNSRIRFAGEEAVPPNTAFRLALLILAALSLAFTTFSDQPVLFARPAGWPKPSYDFSRNPQTAAGFRLGRMLFYDPALSRDGSISCASCHSPQSAFTHSDHRVSHGIEGRQGERNAPALVNLAWNTSFHWDGGVNNLEIQAVNPVTHPNEMDFTMDEMVDRLNASRAYRGRFFRAFADSAITGQRVLKALAQFTVSLQSYNAKYDKYLRHEAGGEMSEPELNGLRLFRQHCASCHQEPLFTNNTFANNGLLPDTLLRDRGRYRITAQPDDDYKFRVPTLRNIEFSAPYMHDGRFRYLRQTIQHYTSGTIVPSPTLAPQLRQPVTLSTAEQRDIMLFLFTLTDKEFLDDARFRYQPE
ncbi:cytochrome-c peroxidase [Hymenobacter negativus]|uniref:Cytochrome-c peroxidase n=1 Tax=Hymenobacter negativus TaxID=2795026 RepID=A0ABS3QET8_9BACT|nr:cytochrome c peroxidase [Hymenobacter negativus]MBO2009498.1 cytochrome-c peroxidase [Hymenobacter negativus]